MPARSSAALVEPDGDSTPIAPRPSHGTEVERARASAQVEAAMVAAKRFPRDEAAAVLRMRSATDRIELARVGFYRYTRGGTTINDLTIHVARELARCWGNIDYGVVEISRDIAAQHSEMLAYAWDMETNTRSATTFIVPWVRDANGRLVALDNPRDVYENNANVAARRVREQIKAVMPGWLFDEAKERLKDTATRAQSNVPIETQRVNAIEKFGVLGVVRQQLEDKLRRKADEWTAQDMFDLSVIYSSLSNRETTIEEEFGGRAPRKRAALDEQPDRAAEDVTEPAAPAQEQPQPEPEQTPAEGANVATPSGAMTGATASAISAWFEDHALAGDRKVVRAKREWIVREVLDMPDLASATDLDETQARELLTRLTALTAEDLAARFGVEKPQ
jgi:hypothetical protein